MNEVLIRKQYAEKNYCTLCMINFLFFKFFFTLRKTIAFCYIHQIHTYTLKHLKILWNEINTFTSYYATDKWQ